MGVVLVNLVMVVLHVLTTKINLFTFKLTWGFLIANVIAVLYGLGLVGWNLYQITSGKTKTRVNWLLRTELRRTFLKSTLPLTTSMIKNIMMVFLAKLNSQMVTIISGFG